MSSADASASTKRAPTDMQVVKRLWQAVEPQVRPPHSPNYHRLSLSVVNVLRAFGRAIRAEHGIEVNPQDFALERAIADEMFVSIPLVWESFEPRVSRLVAQYRQDMEAACALSNLFTEPHEEDEAVDRFAAVMKDRFAQEREEGRGDWHAISEQALLELLHEDMVRGDLVGVAMAALMLHLKSRAPSEQPDPESTSSRMRPRT